MRHVGVCGSGPSVCVSLTVCLSVLSDSSCLALSSSAAVNVRLCLLNIEGVKPFSVMSNEVKLMDMQRGGTRGGQ